MVSAGLALALGAGALLLMGGGRRARDRDTCAATPATAARWAQARLRVWVDCATRTAAEVEACAQAIPSGRSADAAYVRRRWAARRSVEDAPADGRLAPQQATAATAAVEAPAPPAAVPPAPPGHATAAAPGTPALAAAPNPSLARSLVARLVPRLRERRNYRSLLRQFQTAAAIPSDGVYGGLSENAIRYYGGDPPAAFRPPLATSPEADFGAYTTRVRPGGSADLPADMSFTLEETAPAVSGAVAELLSVGGAGPPFGPPAPMPAEVADKVIVGDAQGEN